jgi:hypothetical protein
MALAHQPSLSNCAALPAELWAFVLNHLDEFEVWMICRNVSKMLRAEAERDFKHHRLPSLRFKWSFSIPDVWDQDDNLQHCSGGCEVDSFDRYSDDGERIFLKLRIRCRLYTGADLLNPGANPYHYLYKNEFWDERLKAAIKKSLVYSDVRSLCGHGRHAGIYAYGAQRFIFMGFSANEVEVPGLHIDVDRNELSFLWKQFSAAYFMEEAYVRRMRRLSGLRFRGPPTIEELREYKQQRLRNDGNSPNAGDFFNGAIDVIGKANAELYARALNIRSQKAHAKASVDEEAPQDVEMRLRRLRRARRRRLSKLIGIGDDGLW